MKPFKVIGICGSCKKKQVPLKICGCRGQPVPIFFCYSCYDYIHALKMNVNYTGDGLKKMNARINNTDLKETVKAVIWQQDPRKMPMVRGP